MSSDYSPFPQGPPIVCRDDDEPPRVSVLELMARARILHDQDTASEPVRCGPGALHVQPADNPVRLEWVPFDGRPHDIQAQTCNMCSRDVTYLWATVGEQGLLRRVEWVNGTSRIVVGTRDQAEAWWVELLAGRAI